MNTPSLERGAVQRAMQESKEAFEREKQMHLEHEAKFIDDLKRAILLDGGYVDRLDQEPVDEQVEIVVGASNGQKVILKHKKQQGGGGSAPGGSSRLMAMKAAFSMEDEEDDDDDEWDPLQVLKDAPDDDDWDDDSSAVSPLSPPQPARERDRERHRERERPPPPQPPLALPKTRDEERAMLARAMRESREAAKGASTSSTNAHTHASSSPYGPPAGDRAVKSAMSPIDRDLEGLPKHSGSVRQSNRRANDYEQVEFEEADPAPRPGMRPLPPPVNSARQSKQERSVDEELKLSEDDAHSKDRQRFMASIVNRSKQDDGDGKALARGRKTGNENSQGGEVLDVGAGKRPGTAGRERQWV